MINFDKLGSMHMIYYDWYISFLGYTTQQEVIKSANYKMRLIKFCFIIFMFQKESFYENCKVEVGVP